MAGRVHGADLRICATVAVEGRARLVPLATGTVSTAAEPSHLVTKTTSQADVFVSR